MRKRSVAEIKELIATIQSPASARGTESSKSAEVRASNPRISASRRRARREPGTARAAIDRHAGRNRSRKEKIWPGKNYRPIFGLNPGAEYGPAKRWPVEKFIAAAKEIQQRTNCAWLLFGGKSDAAHHQPNRIRNPQSAIRNFQSGRQNFAPRTDGALKLCRVLLTNDTGPMHVAAALGTPVVVPFGSTSPELTGPGLPGDPRHRLLKSDAPCSPCFLRECPIDFRCMNGISVERVVEAVMHCSVATAG